MHDEFSDKEDENVSVRCPTMKYVSKIANNACTLECLICKDLNLLKEENENYGNISTQMEATDENDISIRIAYEKCKNTVKGINNIYSTMRAFCQTKEIDCTGWLEFHIRNDPDCKNAVEESLEYGQKLEEYDAFFSRTN